MSKLQQLTATNTSGTLPFASSHSDPHLHLHVQIDFQILIIYKFINKPLSHQEVSTLESSSS